MSLTARGGPTPPLGTMADSNELKPSEILSRLSEGPFGNEATMMAFAKGQVIEGGSPTIKDAIEHEKSIMASLIELLKRMIGEKSG